ncbi:hypothetical protein EDD92_0218 [Streptomyces sp. TLI_185]|nr:hypothetical protein EDD92_0218 [Streptomyces sp. TLI_185]
MLLVGQPLGPPGEGGHAPPGGAQVSLLVQVGLYADQPTGGLLLRAHDALR